MEMFTDLLAAVVISLKSITSHLSLEAGVSQSGAVKILQIHRWQKCKYCNEDTQIGGSNCTHWITKCYRNTSGRCTNIAIKTPRLVSPIVHIGSQNAARRSRYKQARFSSKMRPISVSAEVNLQN
jgi:hypothetical protein